MRGSRPATVASCGRAGSQCSQEGQVPLSVAMAAARTPNPLSANSQRQMYKTPYGWYPAARGKHFARPEYKNFSTFDEELSFRQQNLLAPNAPIIPSELLVTSMARRPRTASATSAGGAGRRSGAGETPPMLRQIHRQQLEQQQQRQRQRQHMWKVENSRAEKFKQFENRLALHMTQPAAGWTPGYPEPDLRRAFSPVFSESSRPSSASCSMSVPAADTAESSIPVDVQPPSRPAAPPPQAYERVVRKSRPKTAPPSFLMAKQLGLAADKETKPSVQNAWTAAAAAPATDGVVGMLIESTPLNPPETSPEEVEEEVPVEEVQQEEEEEPPLDARSDVSEEATLLEDKYDKALNRHGWVMEIPGDPLNLKTKYLPQRLPITVKIPIPEVLDAAPRMKRTNKTTFFQVTIPKKPLSFDIHPDFVSEHYNKTRDELRKQGMWNYATKDFAFIY